MKLRCAIDDDDRVATLRQYDILDTRPEREYDHVVAMLRSSCGVTHSAITLVDMDRQWFKAQEGFDVLETGRSVSFCSVAMHLSETLVVDDTHRDRRFAHNLLVTGEPHIRFYAGAPLVSTEGFPLGAVCLVDRKPRTLLPWQLQLLDRARDWVQASLEVRRLDRLIRQDDATSDTVPRNVGKWRAFAEYRAGEALDVLLEYHAKHGRTAVAP